jgi:hypothetical protein
MHRVGAGRIEVIREALLLTATATATANTTAEDALKQKREHTFGLYAHVEKHGDFLG